MLLANYDQLKIIHKNQVLHNTAQKNQVFFSECDQIYGFDGKKSLIKSFTFWKV